MSLLSKQRISRINSLTCIFAVLMLMVTLLTPITSTAANAVMGQKTSEEWIGKGTYYTCPILVCSRSFTMDLKIVSNHSGKWSGSLDESLHGYPVSVAGSFSVVSGGVTMNFHSSMFTYTSFIRTRSTTAQGTWQEHNGYIAGTFYLTRK